MFSKAWSCCNLISPSLSLSLSGKMETAMHLSPLWRVAAIQGSQLGRSQLRPRPESLLIFLFNYLLSLYPRICHHHRVYERKRDIYRKEKCLFYFHPTMNQLYIFPQLTVSIFQFPSPHVAVRVVML